MTRQGYKRQHGDNQEEGKIEVVVIKPKRELRKKDEPPKLQTLSVF